MQHEHRCSYCDHGHTISPNEIQTAWAFLKCEDCGKLSILRARRAEREITPTRKSAQPTSSHLKPPPFLAPPPPSAASPSNPTASSAPVKPAPSDETFPSRIAVKGATRFNLLKKNRGNLSAGLLIIAVGVLILSAQRLRSQAERLLESPPLAAIPAPPSEAATPTTIEQTAPTPASDEAKATPPPAQASAADSIPAAPTVALTPPDAVRTSAAAPTVAAAPTPFLVSVTKGSVILRSGPGVKFQRIGMAGTDAKLPVIDWRGEWFHVALGDARLSAGDGTAWIRNDLVKRIAP